MPGIFEGLAAVFSAKDNQTAKEAAEELKLKVQQTEDKVQKLTTELAERDQEIVQLKAKLAEFEQEEKPAEETEEKLSATLKENSDLLSRVTALEEKLKAQVEHTKKIVEDNGVETENLSQKAPTNTEKTVQDEEAAREELASMSREDRGQEAYLAALSYRRELNKVGAEKTEG